MTVKYVDTAGNKIAEDVVKSGNVGDDYKTDQLSIPGYTFREVQGNVTGKFTNTAQTVTYVYNKVGTNTPSKPVANGNVTVRYVDESNSEIAKAEVITGKAGTAYKTEKKDIDGYIFKEVQGAVSGKITAFGQTVTYVYQKEKASNPGTNMPTKPVNPKTNTPTVPVVDNNNDNGSNSGNSNNNGNSDSNSTTNNETNNIVKNVVENVQTVLPKTAAEKVTWTEIVSLVLASLAGLIVWKKRK
ncbi:MucBP domain-containing protein [Weissella kandleri]|uniref:MucBP domain-containing protein n=1 Tax=Weissella kandleri TaxID=1616 RepID=UPI00387E2781